MKVKCKQGILESNELLSKINAAIDKLPPNVVDYVSVTKNEYMLLINNPSVYRGSVFKGHDNFDNLYIMSNSYDDYSFKVNIKVDNE